MRGAPKNEYQKRYVKICGNLYPEESERVAHYRPDIMGWIFSLLSPRRVTVESSEVQIGIIRERYPSILHAAVFSGNDPSEILSIKNRQIFDIFQVAEPSLFLMELMANFGERGKGGVAELFTTRSSIGQGSSHAWIIPALRVRERLTDGDLLESGPAPFYILDSYVLDRPGGTGRRLDLTLIDGITLPFFLAGGLNHQNVADALIRSGAIGADVSSGIETGVPGRKDEEKLRGFIEAVRSIGNDTL
jgi:phosphoribosylanthranilate isomerase